MFEVSSCVSGRWYDNEENNLYTKVYDYSAVYGRYGLLRLPVNNTSGVPCFFFPANGPSLSGVTS